MGSPTENCSARLDTPGLCNLAERIECNVGAGIINRELEVEAPK
jgi:hypothetical protein